MQSSDSREINPIGILQETFSQISGPLYVPLLVLSSPALIVSILQTILMGDTKPTPGTLPPLPVSILGLVNAFVFTPIMAGAVIIFVMRYLKQSRLDLKDAINSALGLWPQLVLGLILYVLILIPGFLLLIIPGIFLSLQLGFVLYAIAYEECNAIEGLKSSWNLVKGRWWQVFLASLIVLLLVGIPFLVVTGIVGGIFGAIAGRGMAPLVGGIIGGIMGLLVTPFFNIYYIKLYDRLRETASQ